MGAYIIEHKNGDIWHYTRVGEDFVILRFNEKKLSNEKPLKPSGK